MSTRSAGQCVRTAQVAEYALHALPGRDVAAMEAHLATCLECREELATLQPVVNSFVFWLTDVVRPSPALWDRLARRLDTEEGATPTKAATRSWTEPDWEQVAPGIQCKILASDYDRDRVSMLVRLAPKTDYPPHSHAGVEELHLLNGELWIDERKLAAGDYNRSEPGTADRRVWSETGCTCLLVTSPSDVLAS